MLASASPAQSKPQRSCGCGSGPGRSHAIPGLRPRDQKHDLLDDAIEYLNATLPQGRQRLPHFPNDTAALKRLYLATLALDPTGKGKVRWANRSKAALNAFDMTFDGRVSAGRR